MIWISSLRRTWTLASASRQSRMFGSSRCSRVARVDVDMMSLTVGLSFAQIPLSGGRIIVASDGVWDAISNKAVAKAVKGKPTDGVPQAVIKEAVKARGLRDDTTVLCIDIEPAAGSDAPKLEKSKSLFGRAKSGNSVASDGSSRGLHKSLDWCPQCNKWSVATEGSTRGGAFYCIIHQVRTRLRMGRGFIQRAWAAKVI